MADAAALFMQLEAYRSECRRLLAVRASHAAGSTTIKMVQEVAAQVRTLHALAACTLSLHYTWHCTQHYTRQYIWHYIRHYTRY